MKNPFHIEVAEALVPARLEATRRWVAAHVPGVAKALDKRGFQLQQWPPSMPNVTNKANELSLEHEARLLASDSTKLSMLQNHLYQGDDRPVGELLLPADTKFGHLLVKRYRREPGFQSVDKYWDVPSLSLTQQMITVRERIKTSPFMTWSNDTGASRPLNMELPFLVAGGNGVTVRLEFNWIDNLETSWQHFHDVHISIQEKHGNPFFIANMHYPMPTGNLIPLIEHTTFREKFGFCEPQPDGSLPELFVINIDHVTAQSLLNNRITSYTDIDISAVRLVDDTVFGLLDTFVQHISKCYALKANTSTKAYRDAELLVMLDS